jgi:hypothetical protein
VHLVQTPTFKRDRLVVISEEQLSIGPARNYVLLLLNHRLVLKESIGDTLMEPPPVIRVDGDVLSLD